MISIHQWFTKNTKIPIVAASALLALIWILSATSLVQLKSSHRADVVANLINTLSLALSQNNRVLIESLLDTTMVQLGADEAVICRNGKVIVGLNNSYQDCSKYFSETRMIPGFGDYELSLTYPPVWQSVSLWLILVFGCLFVAFTVFILQRMQLKFSNEILEPFKVGFLERGPMQIQEFDAIRLQLQEAQEAKTQKEIAVAMNVLAAQTAHDIRSPISALNSVVGQLTQIPETHRLIIRSSVNRINDIANQLLTKGKQLASTAAVSQNNLSKTENPLQVDLLSPIVDSLVSEKRMQFREKQNVEIEADLSLGYGLFAKINATEFKRVLSNLTTNAIEALPNANGKLVISIKNEGEWVVVSVQDNGKGIPDHILKKLGEMGVTHGKQGTESGSGLGVYHAKKTIETFGGKFEIISKIDEGTNVLMKLPKSPPPIWFVEKVVLQKGMQVISLDDDLAIHQVWNSRLSPWLLDHSGIGCTHVTFTSGSEFKEWLKHNSGKSEIIENQSESKLLNRLYLIDYELLNQKQTGLEIIEELGLGGKSLLVTSRFEETLIRGKCEKLGIRLIPKAMAGFVPIICSE